MRPQYTTATNTPTVQAKKGPAKLHFVCESAHDLTSNFMFRKKIQQNKFGTAMTLPLWKNSKLFLLLLFLKALLK